MTLVILAESIYDGKPPTQGPKAPQGPKGGQQ